MVTVNINTVIIAQEQKCYRAVCTVDLFNSYERPIPEDPSHFGDADPCPRR